jgi:hypothetical protein
MSYSFWGAFTAAMVIPFLSTISLFSALRQKFFDHERQDEQRFAASDAMLHEIRQDVKELLKR